MPKPDDVFVSYSHKDAKWLEKLQVMLKPLTRAKKLELWDDTKIKPGDKWKEEIKKALARAKIGVLLVSPDFLASDFIDKEELPPLLDAAKKDGLVIFWIAVSASMYEHTPIADYNCANEPAQPLDGLDPSVLNKELVEIGNKLHAAANP